MISEEEREMMSSCYEMDRRRTDVRMNVLTNSIHKIERDLDRLTTKINTGVTVTLSFFGIVVVIIGAFWQYQEKVDTQHRHILEQVSHKVHENTLKIDDK